MRRKFLIAEQDDVFAQKLNAALQEKGADCIIARSEKDAQSQIAQNQFYAVILNYELQHSSAQEVLDLIKKKNPLTKFFVLFNDQKVRREAGSFIGKDRTGITEIVGKDFEIKRILSLILGFDGEKEIRNNLIAKSCTPKSEVVSQELITIEDSDLFSLRISLFKEKEFASFDSYIKLSAGKYSLLSKKGEHLNFKKISHSEREDLTHLYCRCSDRLELLRSFTKELTSISASSIKDSPFKIADLIAGSMELMLNELVKNGFHPEEIHLAEILVSKTHTLLKEQPAIGSCLLEQIEKEDIVKTHSIIATVITSLICQNLAWVSPRMAEEFLLAALIQNIGLLRSGFVSVDTEVSINEEQKKDFGNHPILGFRFLQNYSVSEKIRQVVLQHHESYDGSGFPFGLKGKNIFPPARIIFLAANLADLMLAKNLSLKASLEKMIQDPSKRVKVDPNILRALVGGLTKKQ